MHEHNLETDALNFAMASVALPSEGGDLCPVDQIENTQIMWSDGRLAFLTEMSLRRTDRFPIGTLDYKSAQLSAT